jgi:hypothetical protein
MHSRLIKHTIFVLTALALLLTPMWNAPAEAMSKSGIVHGMNVDKNCTDKAPMNDCTKMPCAGVACVPDLAATPHAIALNAPDVLSFRRDWRIQKTLAWLTQSPDPFPPKRPIIA